MKSNTNKPKVDRNKDLVAKRDDKRDPWPFRKLAAHFNITVSRAYEIYEENRERYSVQGVDK